MIGRKIKYECRGFITLILEDDKRDLAHLHRLAKYHKLKLEKEGLQGTDYTCHYSGEFHDLLVFINSLDIVTDNSLECTNVS